MIDVTELLLDFILGLICFYAGYRYHEFIMTLRVHRVINSLADRLTEGPSARNEDTGEQLECPMYELKHEYENGVHYFYFKDDDAFAGQGRTLEEAAQHFKDITRGEGSGFFRMSTSNEEYAFVAGEVHDASIRKIRL